MKKEKLIPPDPGQCQGYRRIGGFMSFGPPAFIRCARKPVYIAWVKNKRGKMTLCEPCKLICEKQVPYSRFKLLSPKSEEKGGE